MVNDCVLSVPGLADRDGLGYGQRRRGSHSWGFKELAVVFEGKVYYNEGDKGKVSEKGRHL